MARPRGTELRRRERAFLESLAELGNFSQAASASGIDPGHALRLLDEDDYRAVAMALREGRIGPTVVVVDPPPVATRAA